LIKRIKGYEIKYNEKEKTWKFPVFKGGEELTAFGYKSEAEEWIYDQLGSEFKNGGNIDFVSDLIEGIKTFSKPKKREVTFNLGKTISINTVETALGRKIDSWKDDVISIGGQKYRKVYLRNEYKKID